MKLLCAGGLGGPQPQGKSELHLKLASCGFDTWVLLTCMVQGPSSHASPSNKVRCFLQEDSLSAKNEFTVRNNQAQEKRHLTQLA